MGQGRKPVLMGALCSLLLLPCLAQAVVYPDHGAFPTAMGSSYYKKNGYNPDGTLTANPVVEAGAMAVGGLTYRLKKLQSQDAITFKGKSYVVYSAVPENMTIDYAYQHTAGYYDPNALTGLDFPNPPPAQVNSGQPTQLAADKVTSPYTNEDVFLTVPGSGAAFFIPNLPNSGGGHGGLTANIYWTLDQYLGRTGFAPNGPVYHLTPYGWAQDPRDVNKSIFLQNIADDGGTPLSGTTLILQAQTPFNYFKYLLTGQDYQGNPYRPKLFTEIKKNTQYPFPPKSYQSGDYPSWLNSGLYLPFQPMPGFQRNEIRWYTAWGSWNLLNNTSGLYVRQDGVVELPAYDAGGGAWQRYPLVTQTWDGSQRYTVVNTTSQVIPSSYDMYPGSEVYFAANAFLPGRAGVLASYLDYTIWDGTATLDPRQTDMWLGLKGDTPADVMVWADAKTNPLQPSTWTEPGGQANKPYMLGADSTQKSGGLTHTCRLQTSNSFFVAQLTGAEVQGKLYDASFYVDTGDGNHVLVATLSYDWRPWTIGSDGNWTSSGTGRGAGVGKIKVYNLPAGVEVKTSVGKDWNPTARTMGWDERPYQSGDHNASGQAPQIYFINGSTTNSNYKFLVVLTEKAGNPPPTLLLLDDAPQR